MKIVVTGGTGFLGRRIAERFSREWEVLTPTRWELDITSEASVRRYLEQAKPAGIIHCAAISNVGACEREPGESRAINVDGAVNIAMTAAELGAACVLCSSDQVYVGAPGRQAHREEETLTPGNVYGKQKRTMERRCLRCNPDSVLLRLPWMYDTRRMGMGEHGNFMETLLEDLRAGRLLRYPIHDRRGLTNVNLVAENMEKALSLPGGVYNFGCESDRSMFETMEDVFAQLGRRVTLEENREAFAEHPRNIAMDTEKIQSYGIRFPTTVQGLVETLSSI